ncbi:MAG: orotate phosphoribosyltransferase [Chloroflexota bacterium]|nr:orotate phosphoribosyltransferase [Chloroflexota bacterium]
MQTSTGIEQIFEQAGALRDGHFMLKSGRHSGRYLEKFAVLQHPELAVEICRRFASILAPFSPTLVVGPTTGGVLLAFETARQLGGGVRGIFAEPIERGRALRRGWEVSASDRVVLVDDILTTGASLLETADAVRAAGAEPLAAAVIVDRSSAPLELTVPILSLGAIEVPSWPATDCPLCAAGEPLTRPGSS